MVNLRIHIDLDATLGLDSSVKPRHNAAARTAHAAGIHARNEQNDPSSVHARVSSTQISGWVYYRLNLFVIVKNELCIAKNKNWILLQKFGSKI